MALVTEGTDIEALTIIGAKINKAWDGATEALGGLSLEDLAQFEDYLDSQQTLMPMSDPTVYIRGGADALDAASKRVRILRSLIRALEN